MVGRWKVYQLSIDETAMLLSGQMVRNEYGTFYFDQPGVWVDKDGWPDYTRLHRIDGTAVIYSTGQQQWYINSEFIK
jgi:hypothetical protein